MADRVQRNLSAVGPEIAVVYPVRWEEEYRREGFVQDWLETSPALFRKAIDGNPHRGRLSARLGTLDLFAQYALQFLLARDSVESITWYKLASISPSAKNRDRTDGHWRTMREIMGDTTFERLQRAVLAASFSNFTGEPDLFCWTKSKEWFFAEAKRQDKISERQAKWFLLCQRTTARAVNVYRLVREKN